MILAERAARMAAEIEAQEAKALRLEIERLKLTIARLRHERFGPSSERSARLEQLELTLEDLEEATAEAEAQTAGDSTEVRAFTRRRPARRPSTCPAIAWFIPGPSPARAAAGRGSANWVRTSPRASSASRQAGV
jgi:transposase